MGRYTVKFTVQIMSVRHISLVCLSEEDGGGQGTWRGRRRKGNSPKSERASDGKVTPGQAKDAVSR